MSIHEYLLKARQDDAVRAGERDRRLLEARRARMAGRHRPEPATVAATIARVAPVGWLARLMFRALPRDPCAGAKLPGGAGRDRIARVELERAAVA
jgi:hypothetical protein